MHRSRLNTLDLHIALGRIQMAPKAKKGTNAQKSKGGEEEREEPLQAVIFADAFETKFAPFTLERPRVSVSLTSRLQKRSSNVMRVSTAPCQYTAYRVHSRISGECWSRGSDTVLRKPHRAG